MRAGSVDGDHEEILNGYVHQSDRSGILASWRGVDPESQVKSYWVAVGSQPRKNFLHGLAEICHIIYTLL